MDETLLDPRASWTCQCLEKICGPDERGICFVIATGMKSIGWRQLEHLAERVILVVANGARIFENNKLIQAQTWDAMVDKALVHLKESAEITCRNCKDGGFVKKGNCFYRP